jgi:hypothetical protein
MTFKLDPDEKKLLESFERGDWKPKPGYEIARMRELARQQRRVDVEAGFNTFARSDGHSLDAGSGRRIADQIKARGRATRSTKP